MDLYMTVTAEFDGGHLGDKAHALHHHGHHYRIEATASGKDETLTDDLERLASEFEGRDVEDMLNGGGSDVCSMAANFLERLMLAHPGMTQVAVWESERVCGRAVRTRTGRA
jgi:hypothetical protein